MSVVEAPVEISKKKPQEGFVAGILVCIVVGFVLPVVVHVSRFLAIILLFLLFFAQVAFGAIVRQIKVVYRSVDQYVTGTQYVPRRANS